VADPTPVRLQRSRARGSKLTSPNGLPVVCVTRGTKWGNPYVVDIRAGFGAEATEIQRRTAVENYRKNMLGQVSEPLFRVPSAEEARHELAGKNLACWCKSGDICHADVLLEIANG